MLRGVSGDVFDDSLVLSSDKILREQHHLGIDARPDPARSANESLDVTPVPGT